MTANASTPNTTPTAIVTGGFGEAKDVLRIIQASLPAGPLGPDQAHIQTLYAPINPADFLRMRGDFGFPFGGDFTLGGEACGRVMEVGSDVPPEQLKPGDLVVLPFGNTWAEEQVLPADKCVSVNPAADPQQVAFLGINGITPELLLETTDLQEGDWMIQNAANGAVGQLVIKAAQSRGIRTCNIVRSDRGKAQLNGIVGENDVIVVGYQNDLKSRVAEATGNAVIKLGLDAVSGESAGALLSCIGFGGHLTCYGLLSGKPLTLPASKVAFGGVTVAGFSRFRVLMKIGIEDARKRLRSLADKTVKGEIGVEVAKVYDFETEEELYKAMEHAEQESRGGKILLRFNKGNDSGKSGEKKEE